jgi:hypothetical protein
MAEWMIVNERGDLPLAIIRPSIIGGALHEPVPGAWSVCVVVECTCVRMCHLNSPLYHAFLCIDTRTHYMCMCSQICTHLLTRLLGWVDCISAAGAIFTANILGVLKIVPGHEGVLSDCVPVDYVVASTLACAAKVFERPAESVFICQVSAWCGVWMRGCVWWWMGVCDRVFMCVRVCAMSRPRPRARAPCTGATPRACATATSRTTSRRAPSPSPR